MSPYAYSVGDYATSSGPFTLRWATLEALFRERAHEVQIPIDSLCEYANHGEISPESFNNLVHRSLCLTLDAVRSLDWSLFTTADAGGC